jgi:hypothetical protein
LDHLLSRGQGNCVHRNLLKGSEMLKL